MGVGFQPGIVKNFAPWWSHFQSCYHFWWVWWILILKVGPGVKRTTVQRHCNCIICKWPCQWRTQHFAHTSRIGFQEQGDTAIFIQRQWCNPNLFLMCFIENYFTMFTLLFYTSINLIPIKLKEIYFLWKLLSKPALPSCHKSDWFEVFLLKQWRNLLLYPKGKLS